MSDIQRPDSPLQNQELKALESPRSLVLPKRLTLLSSSVRLNRNKTATFLSAWKVKKKEIFKKVLKSIIYKDITMSEGLPLTS